MTTAEKASTIVGRPMTAEEENEVRKAFARFPYTAKFKKTLEFTTLFRFDELRLAHPDWELNKILGNIMLGYSKDIPSALLLEMTQLIIAEWEKKGELEIVAV